MPLVTGHAQDVMELMCLAVRRVYDDWELAYA